MFLLQLPIYMLLLLLVSRDVGSQQKEKLKMLLELGKSLVTNEMRSVS